MNKKVICVIANGYAEEMMASVLMDALRTKLQERGKADGVLFVGGSLVSSGRWYQDKRFATFFSGGISPSGGFPTRSWGGFFSDLFAGVFKGPFALARFIESWGENGLGLVIVVGDFLLLATAIPALKKKGVPCIFIPTAKSDHIQPHFKIEKKYIKKYAVRSFPRDEITTRNFLEYGIDAEYCGNLMQDLLDPTAKPMTAANPIVALLPGSREESYGNLAKMLPVVKGVGSPIHWALVQAGSLNPEKIAQVFQSQGWRRQDVGVPAASGMTQGAGRGQETLADAAASGMTQGAGRGQETLADAAASGMTRGAGRGQESLEETDAVRMADECWSDGVKKIYVYSGSHFDSVALGCRAGISLAGSAGEQLAGLGKPVLGFKGTGPQSTEGRMADNAKLIGEAFIYEKSYPYGAINTLNRILADESWYAKLSASGLKRFGPAGGAVKMAERIADLYL